MRSNLAQSLFDENIVRSQRMWGDRRIMIGNVTLRQKGHPLHFLDPDGSTRSLTLPDPELGRGFFIFNVGGSGALTVKNELGTALVTLTSGQGCCVMSSATEWALISGGASYPTQVVKTADYTVDATLDDHILVDTTAGAVTITLPALATRTSGRPFKVVDVGGAAATNNVIIAPNGLETIAGQATRSIIFAYGSLTVWPRSGGSSWYI